MCDSAQPASSHGGKPGCSRENDLGIVTELLEEELKVGNAQGGLQNVKINEEGAVPIGLTLRICW